MQRNLSLAAVGNFFLYFDTVYRTPDEVSVILLINNTAKVSLCYPKKLGRIIVCSHKEVVKLLLTHDHISKVSQSTLCLIRLQM